jgi:hypothetical protein
MAWAADSGGRIKRVRPEITNIVHTNIGMRPSCIPGPRMETMVAQRFTLVAMVPKPATRTARFQKSVLLPGEKARLVSGAYANHPTAGAEPPP